MAVRGARALFVVLAVSAAPAAEEQKIPVCWQKGGIVWLWKGMMWRPEKSFPLDRLVWNRHH